MHARFTTAFSQLPAGLQSALTPLLKQDDFPAFLTAGQAEAVKQTTGLDDDALAFALLPLAAACSLAPVSKFFVGAIARGLSGNLYFGANMEFAGTPLQQTIHAEQCSITHAWLRGERGLASVTVNYTPCGHCRQFMNELNSGTGLSIRLPGRAPATLGDYLPDAFGPRDLNITTLLMDETRHGLKCASQDPLVRQAVDAADQSHAPYSHSYSGIALEAENGAIFTGRYAENAAFNPSLPPLQAALIMMNLAGQNLRHIRRAVLAEDNNATLFQWAVTQATLQALGCSQIDHHPL